MQQNKNHLSNSLKGIGFSKLPSIPYDILFYRQSMENDCSIKDKLYRAPIALARRAFFPETKTIEYMNNPQAKILFYLSDPVRKSNEVNFNKVVSTVENPDTLVERHCKGKFSFVGFYIYIVLLPVWYLQMHGGGLRLIEKYQILKGWCEAYYVQRFFRFINIKKYNLLVCYYDSIIHECMLNLMFKKQGVKAATLQHGQFNAWREDTVANCGLEFGASPSDFHLCWNKFAQDEAIKCGWNKENLPIVGIMSNIGRGQEHCKKPNNGIFGVVISHPYWEHENYEMIKAANILAERYNLKYYLKLHPNYKEDYFRNTVNEHYIGNTKKGIDTLEYTNMVEFTIVGSTSFFVEMVYCYHDILRYSSQLPSDKYRDIYIGSTFNNAQDVIESYERLNVECKSRLFEYLCESTNTRECYKIFFSKFNE